jgi:hypothetical protein
MLMHDDDGRDTVVKPKAANAWKHNRTNNVNEVFIVVFGGLLSLLRYEITGSVGSSSVNG